MEDFKSAKYALFLRSGNMGDINNMSLKDFYGILDFLKRQDDKKSGKPVKLRESQKEMIKKMQRLKKNA